MCGVWTVYDSLPGLKGVTGSCSTPVRHIHEFFTRILADAPIGAGSSGKPMPTNYGIGALDPVTSGIWMKCF
jgi:hypothetical protein